MRVYHEIKTTSLTSALQNGLKRKTSGHKTDPLTQKTDAFLDMHQPVYFKNLGISRQHSLYGYLGSDTTLIDIQTGEVTPLARYSAKQHTTLLMIHVRVELCHISNLDIYDDIKTALKDSESIPSSKAVLYWNSLVPLRSFESGMIARPEVIIPHDIPPSDIVPIG